MSNKTLNIKLLLLIFILFIPYESFANNPSDSITKKDDKKIDYSPKINGTFRAKYEYQFEPGNSRFQVRNARVSLAGPVSRIIDYKAEIDLCDCGKIKMLDAYGRVHWDKVGFITLGQMRVPFGTAVTRPPHLLKFANRSFIAKQVANVRDVGVRLSYAPSALPLKIEAGAYNGSGLKNQNEWHNDFAFAARAGLNTHGIRFEVSGMSLIPDDIRINLFDTSLSWTYRNIFIEGEYIYKHYTNDTFEDVHAYHIVGEYKLPIKKWLKHIAFGARFDSMTDNSSGFRNEDGVLQVDDVSKDRVTAGITFASVAKIKAELRLNYEKYIYDDVEFINDSERDKLVVELMIRF